MVCAQGIESFCQRVKQGLEQAVFDEMRHLVELLIDRVVVTQVEVEIRSVFSTRLRGETTRFYQLHIPYFRRYHRSYQLERRLRTAALASP